MSAAERSAELARRIRSEADQAARAGQYDRLNAIADEVEALGSAVAVGEAHAPLEVVETDGMPFVKCSCDGDNPSHVRWQTAHWLTEHWQGTQLEGVAAIHAVIDRQRRAAAK